MYSENSISKKLQAFAEKNDWLISGEYIYGEEQGFLFTGMDGKGVKTFITPVPGITEEQKAELFQTLEKNKITMKLTEYSVTDGFLCVRIKDTVQLKTDDIEFIVALLVGSMQDLDIVTVGRCQECGEMGADKVDFLYDLYCCMHEDCAKAYHAELEAAGSEPDTETETEITKPKKSFGIKEDGTVTTFRKVLFTAAGALVGSIPWLFLPYIMDYVKTFVSKISTSSWVTNFAQSLLTCLCAYLVSTLAIYGYRKSKAKMDLRGRWIVGIVAISFVVLLQFSYIAVLIIKEPSVVLTFSNYFINMIKPAFYINMLLGALIGTVFTLISVLPFFDTSISSRSKKSPAKDTSEDETSEAPATGDDTAETAETAEAPASAETDGIIDEEKDDSAKE